MEKTTNEVRRLCLAADIEDYSSLDTPRQKTAQEDLVHLLQDAANRNNLDRGSWYRQAQGDQEFAVLPEDAPESVVLGAFIDDLNRGLAIRNANARPNERLRLRVAIHSGVAREGALGHAGQAPIAVARYLNAPVLKRVLAQTPTTSLVVLISDSLYQDVVRTRDNGLDPDRYVCVQVAEKRFAAYAWLSVPAHDPAELQGVDEPESPRPEDAAETDRAPAPAPAAPAGPTLHNATFNNQGGISFGTGDAAYNITKHQG